jgi:hypothetical protein
MTVEKRHVRASGSIDLDSALLTPDESKSVLEELVPISQRGSESKSSGDIFIGGGGTAAYVYENVRILYYWNIAQRESGAAAVVIYWKNRGCN